VQLVGHLYIHTFARKNENKLLEINLYTVFNAHLAHVEKTPLVNVNVLPYIKDITSYISIKNPTD